MVNFTHFGKIGDMLYSMYFCNEFVHYLGEEKFNLHIQTNVHYKPSNIVSGSVEDFPVVLSTQDAEFILPFFKSQSFINDITFDDNKPEDYIDLDIYLNSAVNSYSEEIRGWYYICSKVMLPREHWKKIFFIQPNYRYRNKILFTLTQRYVNCSIDYRQLEQFKDDLVFIGTQNEYNFFCQHCFKMDYAGKFNNLLEIAQIIEGAGGYIANPTGLFALAEGLKVPRILMPCDYMYIGGQVQKGPTNVTPLGGINALAHNTFGLVNAIEDLKRMRLVK